MTPYIAKKYCFNIKTGHYEKLNFLNEDNNTQQQNTQQQEQQNNGSIENNQTKAALTNIETTEVAALKQEKDSAIAKCNNDIKKVSDQMHILESKYNDAVQKYNSDDSGQYDPKQVYNIQKQLIVVKKQFEDNTLKLAQTTHDYNVKILNLQNSLLESMYTIPGKYRYLNESNIHSAKVYINSLVGEEFPITGMVGVKHAFKTSQLFYGKDKEGYFILCIDQEDFDRMYQALTNAGYSREEILDAIMPQVFDRRELVK